VNHRRILVANRGEIALRIVRTLRVMGACPIAVFSDADATAPHVRLADLAVPLGESEVSSSYLNADNIIAAAVLTNADAIIPGYGFLSENADFAQRCADAGLTFIGPSPECIRQMGSKIEARALAQAENVPLVPGGPAETLEQAIHTAQVLGFPLLIKASAGGGGKGMRIVYSNSELKSAFERAQSEARRAFGSERVYLERAILNARHIEVQVIGDSHGNILVLGERECSVQRRHQKVIEECPAPNLLPHTRAGLYAASLALARAVDYRSVGTVEYLVDDAGQFYFLEMNTRLQVEHTVTELVTGLDLVELMVRIADGENIAALQANTTRGWAIQARLYAEDPDNNYQPSIGQLQLVRQPCGPGIRFDHWLQAHTDITRFYDPLLGKLCAFGENRDQARVRLIAALRELTLSGIKTNLGQLLMALDADAFVRGKYHTNLLETLAPPDPSSFDDTSLVAVAAARYAHDLSPRETPNEPHQVSPWVQAFRPQ
jgi:acetyl/propionyl-CoA carboxylase alpha subunit